MPVYIKEFRVPAAVCVCIIVYLVLQWFGLDWLALAVAGVGIILGSYSLVKESLVALNRKQYGLDYIAILAIVVSLATGEYLAGLVIALMSATGRTLEEYGTRRARRSLTQLIDRIPREITVCQDGSPCGTVPVEQVAVGQQVLVRKGEVIALDGIVLSDFAQTDESSLTGEPYLLDKTTGDALRSGTINIGGSLMMQVTHRAGDSTYDKIIALVQAAAAEKPPLVRLADRYSTVFTIITLLMAAAAYGLSGDPLRVLAVLVVATPCPLLLATPIALMGGVNALAKHKIIVKKLASLEVLSRLNAVLFDKTGTITLGQPTVTRVDLKTTNYPLATILSIAAAIERHSLHPLAKAIVAYAKAQAVAPMIATEVHEKLGQGIFGMVDQQHYSLQKYQQSGELAIVVLTDNVELAVIHFSDEIKADSRQVLQHLKQQGLTLMMLTGDKQYQADKIANQLDNLMIVQAECTPEQKQQRIAEFKANHQVVAMIGDGINDAPALAAADVGIVFSNEQQTAASEAADVVILTSEFEQTLKTITVAQRTIRIAKQSILWGIGLSIVAMIAAAFGYIPPIVGAVLQEGIDLLVILNALRASRS